MKNLAQPPRPTGEGVRDLIELMDVLRSPGGCPWDAAQTHESLLEYLLEESYETVDAVHSGDREALREELGDVLLQVAFHARIAQEHLTDPFDIDDVARTITEKLRRRHPHVFAGEQAPAAHEAQARWEELKAAEKQRASVTDGVPDSMPASLLAVKLLGRASRRPHTADVPAVANGTVSALAVRVLQELSAPGISSDTPAADDAQDRAQTAVGELLLGIIAAAAAQGIDTERALRDAVRDYRRRVRVAEGTAGVTTE